MQSKIKVSHIDLEPIFSVDWKKAPKDAKAWVKSPNDFCYWYDEKPYLESNGSDWDFLFSLDHCICMSECFGYAGDWRDSIVMRPEPALDISLATNFIIDYICINRRCDRLLRHDENGKILVWDENNNTWEFSKFYNYLYDSIGEIKDALPIENSIVKPVMLKGKF